MAESKTKDFDLVPTIASTGGSKKKKKKRKHWVTSTTASEHQDPAERSWERIPPCPVPEAISPSGVNPPKDLSARSDFSTLTSFLHSFVS